jgi:uncharacterized protein YkwD
MTDPRPYRRSRLTVVALAIVLAFGGHLLGTPASPAAAASPVSDIERTVRDWVNRDRAAIGLVPLRADLRLWDLAGDRARQMTSANTLSHAVAGDLGAQLAARSIQWFQYGETIGRSTTSGATSAAAHIYSIWKSSPSHWALLMSDRFNYLGVGIDRASNGTRYASIVVTESRDRTGAKATILSATRDGRTIRWTWRGRDVALQTHTAGLKDFDVRYRKGSGTWRTIRSGTTSTDLTLRDRARGSWYSISVRARDARGNVGAWTPASRIWVP